LRATQISSQRMIAAGVGEMTKAQDVATLIRDYAPMPASQLERPNDCAAAK
jgi:hypothetical protein